MKNYLLSPLLGLFVVIGGVTVSTSVDAFTLHNYYSNTLQKDYCLAVAGVAPNNQKVGASIIVWPCDGTPGQDWGYNGQGVALPPPPSNGSYLGWYLVSSVAPNPSNRYLTAGYTSSQLGGRSPYINNGSPVFVSTSAGAAPNQQWLMQWQGRDFTQHDCYSIESHGDYSSAGGNAPPMVLGVSGGSKTQGTAVIMWQQFFTASGAPDYKGHPDQYWCVYQ